ncbi:MAG: GNAT family N-acetyltransferase [Verrucomicrobia bacterium]|nr:GNAT family N-acetyltransferase [Verrucomicrobiota bacterium]
MFTKVETLKQIQTISRLAQEIWEESYFPIVGKEQAEYMLKKFHSTEVITHQILEENHVYFLIEQDNRPAGYLATLPWLENLHLSEICVKPSPRSSEQNRSAIHFAERIACELGKPFITLTANKCNSNAIATYSRWGFCIVDEVVLDIGNGFVTNDYVMRKQMLAES